MLDKNYDRARASESIHPEDLRKISHLECIGSALEQSAVTRDGTEDDDRLASLFNVRIIFNALSLIQRLT